jgi:hypothetical protein
MSDTLDGIIIGAAAAAIGTIVAVKFLNRTPLGGGMPPQPDINRPVYPGQAGNYVISDAAISIAADTDSPVGNIIPISEASFSNPNSGLISYEPATGYETNRAQDEALLPI